MAAINSVADLTLEGDIAVLTIKSPPVNALSAKVREGLRDGMRAAAADPAAKAVVLICAGRTFIAGADISEFGKPFSGATLPEAQAAIEDCPKPVDGRHPWHGARRRVRGRAGRALSRRRPVRETRPAGDQARPHSRRRRHAAVAAAHRSRGGAGGDPVGNAVRRQAGARLGRRRRPRRRGRAARGGDRLRPRRARQGLPLRKVRDLDDKVLAARGKPEIFAAIRKANAKKFRGYEAWEKAIGAVQRRGRTSFR